MKRISPKIFESSLERTFNRHPGVTAESFMKFFESQGYKFVDVKTQPQYKKGTIRTMKVKTRDKKD